MTSPNDQTPDQTSDRPLSPQGYWAGWLSLAFTTAGMILIFMGDPLWLGLPSSILGVLAGRYALRRGQENHVGAHLGFNLGLLNLCIWLVLIILVQYVFKSAPMSLFGIIPS